MSRSVVFRPKAERDLQDIWEYSVETWSEAQAEAYLRALSSAVQTLADFPEAARERREFTPPVRIHPHGAHLIVYVVGPDAIEVIRVLHGRSHWEALLRD